MHLLTLVLEGSVDQILCEREPLPEGREIGLDSGHVDVEVQLEHVPELRLVGDVEEVLGEVEQVFLRILMVAGMPHAGVQREVVLVEARTLAVHVGPAVGGAAEGSWKDSFFFYICPFQPMDLVNLLPVGMIFITVVVE